MREVAVAFCKDARRNRRARMNEPALKKAR
jgi:hypothetical protein